MISETDSERADWNVRPWLLAAMGAFTGAIIHLILGDDNFRPELLSALKTASVAFVGSLAILTGFTLERERWQWSIIFAFIAALAIGPILYWNGAPDQWSGGDGWRVVCIFLSVAIAAPLFQTARDQGARRFPYAEVHSHALTNVVIWCAGWAFVGIVFLLTLLLSELFALIKITLIKDLLDENWFVRVLMGASFGAAIGILREQDRIVRVLQRVIVAVLSVLAPVLGAGLLLFLLSLPFTGLSALWDATKATTPILLSCVIGALILANAVIGNSDEEERRSPPLRYGAMALGLAMLPLGVIAAISTGLRIGQYGFTPDRLWALVFVVIACAYGLAYLVALLRGRLNWADHLRPANLKLAFGLCAIGLFLALPILSFNAISTRDQVARLEKGRVTPEKFDWAALRYDFGEAGKAAVDRLARSSSPAIAKAAKAALAADTRWDLAERQTNAVRAERVRRTIRIVPEQVALPRGLLESFNLGWGDDASYVLHFVPGEQSAVLVGRYCRDCPLNVQVTRLDAKGAWSTDRADRPVVQKPVEARPGVAISGDIEVREVKRRQVFVNGDPLGDAFE